MGIGRVVVESPLLALTLAVIGAAIFVNGWTDAPMAITSCVASGALRFRRAAVLAAICNLLGLAVSARFFPGVADTVLELVTLPTDDSPRALGCLLCALATTVLWAVIAWLFGLPTSESHALFSGLGGAAVALAGSAAITVGHWIRVILGLLVSLFGGALCGLLAGIAVECAWQRMRWGEKPKAAEGMLIGSAATMSFMHGAQDGQKFMGMWLLACQIGGKSHVPTAWVALICAIFMGTGTLLGGGRIVRTLGERLIDTDLREGIAADLGGAVCLLFLTFFGIPVSTTHTKTAAIIGTGVTMRQGHMNKGTVRSLLAAWLLTFPICFLISFVAMRLLLMFGL